MATKKNRFAPRYGPVLKTLRNTLRFVFSFWRLRSAPTAVGCLIPIGCLVFIAGWLIVRKGSPSLLPSPLRPSVPASHSNRKSSLHQSPMDSCHFLLVH